MGPRLSRSRSPPAPKTTTSEPSQRPARDRERPLERVGRVGVVDRRRAGAPSCRRRRSKRPRGTGASARAAAACVRRDPADHRRRERAERVLGVDVADGADAERARARARARRAPRGRRACRSQVARPTSRAAPPPRRRRRARAPRSARRARPSGTTSASSSRRLVGGVEHRRAAARQAHEQLRLARQVVLRRPVGVEVIVRQVGEDAHRTRPRPREAAGQRLARQLDGREASARDRAPPASSPGIPRSRASSRTASSSRNEPSVVVCATGARRAPGTPRSIAWSTSCRSSP